MNQITPEIIFINNHFIVADKPAKWLSVPSRIGDKDQRECLGLWLQNQFGRVYPVHRLDFEVSGLILFARDSDSHRAANLWFEKKQIQKTYCAFSDLPPLAEGLQIWNSKVKKGKKRTFESANGVEAITEAICNSHLRFEDMDLYSWDLKPITGRSHQLRFEMYKNKHPIVGDLLYGSKLKLKSGAIALRAYKMDFTYSEKQERFDLPKVIEISKSFEFFSDIAR